MITIQATEEEVDEVLESIHRSLHVYMGRVKKGDKVAARKWKLLTAFRDHVVTCQFEFVEDVEGQ